jgi:hypothetical protein
MPEVIVHEHDLPDDLRLDRLDLLFGIGRDDTRELGSYRGCVLAVRVGDPRKVFLQSISDILEALPDLRRQFGDDAYGIYIEIAYRDAERRRIEAEDGE